MAAKPRSTGPGPLSADQARKLCAAEERCAAATKEKKAADEARKKLRKRLRPRLTLGEQVRAGGVAVTVKMVAKGASFSVKGYLAKHKLTNAMKPFYTGPDTREDWTVERLPEGS